MGAFKIYFWVSEKAKAMLPDQNTERSSSLASRVQWPFHSLSLAFLLYFFLRKKERKLKEPFFQLWERLDGRGGFVWEQNVGWEVL